MDKLMINKKEAIMLYSTAIRFLEQCKKFIDNFRFL